MLRFDWREFQKEMSIRRPQSATDVLALVVPDRHCLLATKSLENLSLFSSEKKCIALQTSA
jgi:hypothetical protein